jgi:hypothetical protein
MHIDDFIDDRTSDVYAAWVLNHFRLPADLKSRFDQFMARHELFATYRGQRYRVTGASRLGDVWLVADFKRDTGYDLRVDVATCGAWGPRP